MHLDHDHTAGGHVHTHADGTPLTHEEMHAMGIPHHPDGTPLTHEEMHAMGIAHTHEDCAHCKTPCEHTPMEELTALMQYMVGHNAAHARELADLAAQLEQIGNHTAYEQVMAAVSDFEKGNLRLTAVLSSLKG